MIKVKELLGSKIAVALSGGATKISFMAGVLLALVSMGVNPVVFIGTSSGSILAVFSALGRYDLIRQYMPIYTLKLIFGKDISKKWVSILGLKSLLKNGHMYEYEGIEGLLRGLITPQDLLSYQRDDSSPDCFIHIASDKDLKETHVSLKSCSYETMISAVIASCSIPFFVPRRKVNGIKNYDGGLINHIASEWLVEAHGDTFDNLISIYSRTNNIDDYTKEDPAFKGWSFKRLLYKAERLFLIKNIVNSFNNFEKTQTECDRRNIGHVAFFAPDVLQKSTFETSEKGNIEMFEKGQNAVK